MKPNILLITTDQQRWDTLGLNGNPLIQTPNLDALAAGGVHFRRAYSTTPSCIAARRTLLTGQHGVTHGLTGYRDGMEFNPTFTIPGLLGSAGYQTQLIGKLHQFPQRKRYGFDHVILSETPDQRLGSPFFGQNDYADWLHDAAGGNVDPSLHGLSGNSRLARPFHLEERFHHSCWVVKQAEEFLMKRRDPSCPWFLHLSFWAPHPPLIPPRPYFDRYEKLSSRWLPAMGEWAPKGAVPPGISPDSPTGPFDLGIIRNAMAGYYGLINHIDDLIGFLWQRVFAPWMPGNGQPTWIIFTSDHGELLGDHHLYRKSLPYEGSSHVPLFIAGHNLQTPSRTSDALTCLEDIGPTILEMADLPVPDAVDGRSLLPLLRGETSAQHEIIFGEHSGRHANHFIVKGDYKYCWFARTREEQLFNLNLDPMETRDLSMEANILPEFRQLLAQRLQGRTDYTYDPGQCVPCENHPPRVFWDS